MPDRHTCDICGTRIEPHAHYIVRIDVFADPSVPPISTEELDETDPGKTLAQLMEEMKHMSADDLQDQVHRRFEYRICQPCQARFLSNPLGQPRQRKIGEN